MGYTSESLLNFNTFSIKHYYFKLHFCFSNLFKSIFSLMNYLFNKKLGMTAANNSKADACRLSGCCNAIFL